MPPVAEPPDPHPDLLAAVVLHTLVTATATAPVTLAQLATACERNPTSPSDLTTIEEALESLIADGLVKRTAAQRKGSHHEARYRATRAALRADALRF